MRLIDADELRERYSGDEFYSAAHIREAVDKAHTVFRIKQKNIDALNSSICDAIETLNEVNRYGALDYADYEVLYNAIDRIGDAADSITPKSCHTKIEGDA